MPVSALEGEVKMQLKDFYTLANRKSYRLGIRGGIISPTDTINLNKDSTFDFGLEFDAKMNENVDSGPRFGLISKKLKTGTTDASYLAVKFGFGGRIYVFYWGEMSSTHGFFNAYVGGTIDYYNASKTSEITAGSPPSFAGFGGYANTGIELAFGPNAGGFVEAGYQRTSIRSSDSQTLPLDGFIVQAGARLAFF